MSSLGKYILTEGSSQCIVLALGGNAIKQAHQRGFVKEQLENIRITCRYIVELINQRHKIIITHGNGPQIGNLLIQQEEAFPEVVAQPMDCCVAMSQGQIGYMLQQVLQNLLKAEGINKNVLTVVTQVIVDGEDAAFKNPTKPIGSFCDAETKARYEKERGYVFKKVRKRGGQTFRRVVASPEPLRILEAEAIKLLVDNDIIVIALGGGGIPVEMNGGGRYYGVDAVLDKDLSAEKLAEAIMADILIILTNVDRVYLNFDTPRQRGLDSLQIEEAKEYIRSGHFPLGSMQPKVEACIRFIELGGKRAIITAMDKLTLAMRGEAGTHFLP